MMEEKHVIRGPLGIWTYPILNALLSILNNVLRLNVLTPKKTTNIEVWEWTDYLGRKRTLTVHREVE